MLIALLKDLSEAAGVNRDFIHARSKAGDGGGEALENYRGKIVSDKKGNHKMSEDFKLVFTVDTSKETAKTIGNKGTFDVEMLYSPSGGMTFIEMIDGGKVLTTTIDFFQD